MKKYWSIFKISLAQEFTYRFNFILGRFRSIIQILIFFFLWDAVFSTGRTQIFGYDHTKILTYIFMLIIVRAIVLSTRSVDVAAQIANGELTNLLLKPVSYFNYWLTRDISSKVLNISFGIFETGFLVVLLKPNIFIQTNILLILAFILSIIIAMFIFFNILMLTNFVPFLVPGLSWGVQSLVVVVIVEFLSGSYLPIDIFPNAVYQFLRFTPFPYLVFIPIKIYLGNFDALMVVQSLLIGAVWGLVLWRLANYVWKKGLLVYDGVGR